MHIARYGFDPRAPDDAADVRRAALVVGWCGMRGIVTLAAALRAAGRDFPIAT